MSEKEFRNLLYMLLTILAVWVVFLLLRKEAMEPAASALTPVETLEMAPQEQETPQGNSLNVPMKNVLLRITKKPFGILIDPKNSPVQPERFSGFHTGTDFETLENELIEDVVVFAVCDGPVVMRNFVSGYGGVIVQSCKIDDALMTVLYGHVDLEKSPAQLNQPFSGGEKIAILADEKSYWSGGERKHLHLGIHRGGEINLRGYVQDKSLLSNWIDFETIGTK